VGLGIFLAAGCRGSRGDGEPAMGGGAAEAPPWLRVADRRWVGLECGAVKADQRRGGGGRRKREGRDNGGHAEAIVLKNARGRRPSKGHTILLGRPFLKMRHIAAFPKKSTFLTPAPKS
jgi:hypothetical protein